MTQMSTNRWTNEQIVAYAHSEILFCHKKEWSMDTCYSNQKHHAKWKKPDTKSRTVYDSIYMKHRK